MFAYRVESANLHLDIDRNQLDIWVCRTGLGIRLHRAKVLLQRKHHLAVLYVTGVGVDFLGDYEAPLKRNQPSVDEDFRQRTDNDPSSSSHLPPSLKQSTYQQQ
jgi:hypothetical protein